MNNPGLERIGESGRLAVTGQVFHRGFDVTRPVWTPPQGSFKTSAIPKCPFSELDFRVEIGVYIALVLASFASPRESFARRDKGEEHKGIVAR